MSELIDTTEMYLRTVFELIEEGIPPMRARIAERLHQSGPTVSQTVARMERDGLLQVEEDRTIRLSEQGYLLAEGVMRKHRLAERLLTDVIGLDWHLLHDEACRWEHVISEEVERKLLAILDSPTSSPYGNPIPGLVRLGAAEPADEFRGDTLPLTDLVREGEELDIVIVRMSEHAQADAQVLADMQRAGVQPGVALRARGTRSGLVIETEAGAVDLTADIADQLYGRPA